MENKYEEIVKDDLVFETYTIREFLGEPVRLVENKYIVMKDMFRGLGRVNGNNSWNNEMRKTIEFLSLIDLMDDLVDIDIKKLQYIDYGNISINDCLEPGIKNIPSSYDEYFKNEKHNPGPMKCLLLDSAYILLTQFKPNISKTNKEKSEMVLKRWSNFMKFIHELILENKNEIEDIVFKDEDYQKANVANAMKLGMNPAKVNEFINIIISKVLKKNKVIYKDYITKDQLKILDECTEIDLLLMRRKVFEMFNRAIKTCIKNNESIDMVQPFIYDYAKKFYKLEYKLNYEKIKKNKQSDRTILHIRKKKEGK